MKALSVVVVVFLSLAAGAAGAAGPARDGRILFVTSFEAGFGRHANLVAADPLTGEWATIGRASIQVRCGLATPAVPGAAAFSPDGREVAFLARDVAGWRIETAPARAPGLARSVISNAALPDTPTAASWSPGGRWLAIAAGAELHVVDLGLRIDRRVAVVPPSIYALGGWSPDGTQLVYASGDRIFVLDTSAWSSHELAKGFLPVWSPDGVWIAYVAHVSREDRELVLVHPDGTGSRAIVHKVAIEDPAWAPNSRRLLYQWHIDVLPHLFVMGVDGSGEREVSARITGGPYKWRPTGVFHTQGAVVARLDVTTGRDLPVPHARGLTAALGDASSDGRRVVYHAWRASRALGLRVVDRGVERPLTACRGTPAADDVLGTRLNDWIDVRGGGRDSVRCGRGRDTVYADRRDRVARDCERVVRTH